MCWVRWIYISGIIVMLALFAAVVISVYEHILFFSFSAYNLTTVAVLLTAFACIYLSLRSYLELPSMGWVKSVIGIGSMLTMILEEHSIRKWCGCGDWSMKNGLTVGHRLRSPLNYLFQAKLHHLPVPIDFHSKCRVWLISLWKYAIINYISMYTSSISFSYRSGRVRNEW
jgi:hypothetical protein